MSGRDECYIFFSPPVSRGDSATKKVESFRFDNEYEYE